MFLSDETTLPAHTKAEKDFLSEVPECAYLYERMRNAKIKRYKS